MSRRNESTVSGRSKVAHGLRCLSFLAHAGWEVSKKDLLLSLTGLVSSLIVAAYPFALAALVGALARHDARRVVVAVMVLAVYSVVPSFLSAAGVHYRLRISDKIGHHFERECADLLSKPRTITFFNNHEVGDALALVVAKKGALGQAFNTVGSVVPLFSSQVVLLVLAIATDWRLAFVAVAGLTENLFQSKVMAWQTEADDQSAPFVRQLQEFMKIGLTPSSNADIRTLHATDDVRGYVRDRVRRWREPIHRRDVKQTLVSVGSGIVFYVVAAAVLVSMGRDTIHGTVSIEALTAAIAFVPKLTNSLAMILMSVTALGSSVHTVDRFLWLREFINTGLEQKAPEDQVPVPAELNQGIDIQGLTVTYAGQTSPALNKVNLHIPAGSVLAVVGENGAGKSTLAQCLLGLIDYEGSIKVDGRELTTIDGWNSATSAVLQDFLKPQMTAVEAVTLGLGTKFGDEDAARNALDRANVGDLCEALPEGFATRLGSLGKGQELSGGQWQKVALARGYARPSPLLTVLDEPTSALDPESEKRLFSSYQKIARDNATYGGITVIISHRLPTSFLADTIVVLDNGDVAEVGSHVQLIHQDGLYAELFRIQSEGYTKE